MKSADDQPSWVTDTISKIVVHPMVHLWLILIKLDELAEQDWGDTADWFRNSDKKHVTTEFNISAVVQSPSEDDAHSSGPLTVGEPMETVDIIPRKSQMLQLTSQPGNWHMRLGSRKPQIQRLILLLQPDAMANLSLS